MQGTYVAETSTGLVCAKGIVRPPLVTSDGRTEEEQHCDKAAFGKHLADGPSGKFYKVQKVGQRDCGFSYQTALFSLEHPEDLIDWDTARFLDLSALDLLSREARKKVECGVPISFLLTEMTPWNLITAFEVEGTRTTVYGSELVPRGDEPTDSAITDAFAAAGISVHSDWETSWFMLLPDTMGKLCRQLNCTPTDLYKMEFLVHRDPALPDGTDLYPARYAGMLKWAGSENGHGIILHPQDPYWKQAGGDFDGDDATIYLRQPFMEPIGPIGRPNYRTKGRKYSSETVADQMVEAAADKTPGMLGSSILGLMRLIERGLGDEANRSLGAAVAQAAVDAKKHPVNHEAVAMANRMVAQQVRDGREVTPSYISDYLNEMGNASGAEAKLAVWGAMCALIDAGWWVNGAPVERALVRRINVLRTLFEEVNWYRELRSQQIPQTIKQAAVAKVNNNKLSDVVTRLTNEYAAESVVLGQFDKDDSDRQTHARRVSELRSKAKLLATTGWIEDVRVEPRLAQYALIAYGPQRLAAQFVPSEVFEELSGTAKTLFVSLGGVALESGIYDVADIRPIPNCERHWAQFAKNCGDKVKVVVLGTAARSTRVRIESL
jgi:hypothetical protein